ncbi:MAG: DEAD/DEAH box helicase family protein [Myxococcales bacterium]|nr:DEAD/DEAH box helicase family protein [Myxococcales bacterium]
METPTLEFDRGTLLLRGVSADQAPEAFVDDPRVDAFRAPGFTYRDGFAELHRQFGTRLNDTARDYHEVELTVRDNRRPFEHQREALRAWHAGGRRGVVVLPTGSGKTFVAELAMAKVGRSSLIVVPTLDLMNQWYSRLLTAFRLDEVGLVGGGYYDVKPVTVTTYDSFSLQAEQLGNRFGLLVFDECHHLPSTTYSAAAECYIAPFRLGLTATPERQDELLSIYEGPVGPIVYRAEIKELAGSHLSEYETRTIQVELNKEERERYTTARETYLGFLRQSGVRLGGRGGWSQFIAMASRTRWGRKALAAYREQKRIALTCQEKMRVVELLLARHQTDRTIIFTSDNETVYQLSQHFLVPAITHQTRIKERQDILDGLKSGRFRAVATSKVLNEGVDIPSASVAIVLSGSGSVREHVQRLGRILRRQEGKQATLYEVLASDTMESSVSERRRDHDAYR